MKSFAQSLSKYLVDSYETLFTHIFMFDNRRKNRPQFFFTGKFTFFSEKIWFFINLLGPKELIWLIPQYLSEYLLDFYNSALGLCHTRYYMKKRRWNNLSTGKIAVFSKICFLNNLLGLKKMLWQAIQYW